MTYSEDLLFVGKCLTLGNHPERIEEVREIIRSGTVVWEQIVWISTGHYVFPALYVQFKKAGLLAELPLDLVEYMEEFANANRVRNLEILEQAHEVAVLLKENGITPLFLKGSGYLLDGLYEDVTERMLGDMDILVGDKDLLKAVAVLKADGYYCQDNENAGVALMHRHYPPLFKEGKIVYVELHRWMVEMPHRKHFNYDLVYPQRKQATNDDQAYVLSDDHQILLNMLVVQMTESGYTSGKFFFRHLYDLYLLSQRSNPLSVISSFGRWFKPFNAYLAVSSWLLSSPPELAGKNTPHARRYLKLIQLEIEHPKLARIYTFTYNFTYQIYYYTSRIVKSTYSKPIRADLREKLGNPKWYGRHLKDVVGRL